MSKSKKLLGILAGIVFALVIFMVWAKHDADAKAASFVSENTKVQATYKSEMARLNLSTLIDVSDSGNEDAKKEQAVCSAADSLKKTLDDFNNTGLHMSLGSWLSSSYNAARATQKASDSSRSKASQELANYSARCKYFSKFTEESNAEKAIRNSKEYTSLLTYGTVTCKKADGGCISRPNYSAFAKVYGKIVDARKGYVEFYKRAQCPLIGDQQQKICEIVKRYTPATLDDAEQYVTALKQGNTSKINELARGGKSGAIFKELKAYVKKLDPSAKSVDDYWRKLFVAQEKQLQQIKI